ncbi:MAG: hypothetical protein RBT19_01480 [Tenuifilaceae bacterium]|jgi:hypothetical protein|nr:hypothetical protein [Tenuifilaceae bacterium]
MALHETLNLRKEEVVPVAMMVFQSVFLGFFLGAFDVSANTLFLNSFDQAMIPKAIVISGLTGIVLTSLYSYFQARIEFSSLAILNLFTVFILTFALRAGYYFSDTKWLAFALFVLMGPLNIVALVGFWGTVGRIFDLRQGKRIFGFIDTGQVVGVIVSSFSIPFLITLGFKTNNLLYISAISIFLALVFQVVIGAKYPNKLKVKAEQSSKRSSFASTLKIPYVRTMAIFVIMSMLVAFFVHFLFLAVASQRFDNPDEMAKYFGGLMGSLTFVSVLIKAFVYGPLMKTYGLKVSLLVSPFVMLFITVSAAAVGSLFGFTLESAAFTLFFLLISLSKFFQKALKDSIESPVLKLVYQSLPPAIRHEVQARVDGTINESAALASGVILALLGLFAVITLLHYVYILIGFILVWFFISLRLFRGYRKTLKQTLEGASIRQVVESPELKWFSGIAHFAAGKQLELLEVSKPWLIPTFIERNLPRVSGDDLRAICDFIEQRALVEMKNMLEARKGGHLSPEDLAIINATQASLNDLMKYIDDEERVATLMNSKDFSERMLAAKIIGLSSKADIRQKLTFLLRDLVPQVKRQALWAARGKRYKEIISFLIDFLDKDEYAPLAHFALMNSGEVGLEMLVTAFSRSGATDSFQQRIIRVIPDTGSAIAQEVLFDKLKVQSFLKTDVLNSLLKLDFVADERESLTLHQMIVEQASVCAWNLNVLHQCPGQDKAPKLREELEVEVYASRHNLFQILKLLYDKSSIDSVIENLEAGTGESISFAIELLDTFVVEDLKPYIFPILEDNSLSNKIWALQNYFPLPEYSSESLLKAIINRNENLIGKQAKIYALNAFRNLVDVGVTADLVAQLFNTDRVLRQLSGQLIKQIDREKYGSYRARLGDRLRVDLDRSLEVCNLIGSSAVDRLEFFSGLPYSKSHAAPLFWLYNSSTMLVSNVDILTLGAFASKKYYILVEKGTLMLEVDGKPQKHFVPGDILVAEGVNTNGMELMASDETVIHYIDYGKFISSIYNYDFLIDYIQ